MHGIYSTKPTRYDSTKILKARIYAPGPLTM